MRHSTLYDKIGSVTGDFAQLQANVCILSRARLSYDVQEFRCIKCIFDLQYFQLTMGLSGCDPIVSPGRSVFLLPLLYR